MGLLDDDYVPPYQPPAPKRYPRQTALTQETRDQELNNLGHEDDTSNEQ